MNNGFLKATTRRMIFAVGALLITAHTGGAKEQALEQPPHYTVQAIAAFPYVSDDIALGLNASGQVALWQNQKDGRLHAMLWDSGKMTDMGVPAGCQNSIARAVNSHAQAAGWANDSGNIVDSLSTTHAALLEKNKAQDLGTLGGKNSQAFGLNDAGAVVGVAMRKDNLRHAFLWQRGKMKDLGSLLPIGGFSAAYGVNRAGHCVGVSAFNARDNHAVLWRNGKIIDLGTLPNGTGSFARAINNKDQIVGFGRVEDDTHAFLYEKGKMVDLGTLGKEPSNANSINEAGVIVGAAAIKNGRRHACIWVQNKPFDLNETIPNAEEWTLREAYKINDAGQIVCLGANKTGVLYSLLLTPVNMKPQAKKP